MEKGHRSEDVVAADDRHDPARFSLGHAREHRAPHLSARGQRARHLGAAHRRRRVGVAAAGGVARRHAAADHVARLVEHEHAAGEKLRDRLAQRRQRGASRQQRRHLLVRLGGGLDAAHVPLQLGARLLGLGERGVGAREVVRVLQRDGAVRGERAEDGDALRRVRAVVSIGDEEQADHFAVPDQRHADERGDAFGAEGVVELGIVREALVVQVVGRREGKPRRHQDAADAAVTARDHVRSALRQGAVGRQNLVLASIGVVGREPGDVGPQQIARARDDRAQQAGEIEPARKVLGRLDDRQHAALALLLQLEPVAHRHRHPHRLDQRRLARMVVGERFDLGEPTSKLVGRCALMEQRDQGAGGLLTDLRWDCAPHRCLSPHGSRHVRRVGPTG